MTWSRVGILAIAWLLPYGIASARPTARFEDVQQPGGTEPASPPASPAGAAAAPRQPERPSPPRSGSAAMPWGYGSAMELIRRATTLERRGRLAEAASLYHEAIRLAPRVGEAYLELGRLRERMNDPREAERVYSHASRIPSVASVALDRRAELRRSLGRPRQALLDLERAVALAPKDQDRLEQLARWYVQASAWPAALAVWRRLLTLRTEAAAARNGIQNPDLREARVRVRALATLASTADPVTAHGRDRHWVRVSLARIALR